MMIMNWNSSLSSHILLSHLSSETFASKMGQCDMLLHFAGYVLKPPNRIKFYGRLIVSFQKRWSTLVDHRRSNDLPIIRQIRLSFIVIHIYKNIYSLSDRNIILFRLSPVRLNLLLVKSIPSVLKILSAVVEVATTHKYFLAKFTRWHSQPWWHIGL